MTPPLFLLDRLPDTPELELVGDEGHHAARVRRVTPGESVLVADGAGGLLRCVVVELTSDGVRLRVLTRETLPAVSPRLVAVQGLPKGERAELAVEMMTELGVDEIVPWSASRSIAKWSGPRGEKALERWRRTSREAGKQSRRPLHPVLAPLATTADVAQRLRGGAAIVLHEDAELPIAAVPLPVDGDVIVVIGPEGGVSPEELAAFAAAGATAVRLGDAVLRTSTAGAAALSALSLRLGRWG